MRIDLDQRPTLDIRHGQWIADRVEPDPKFIAQATGPGCARRMCTGMPSAVDRRDEVVGDTAPHDRSFRQRHVDCHEIDMRANLGGGCLDHGPGIRNAASVSQDRSAQIACKQECRVGCSHLDQPPAGTVVRDQCDTTRLAFCPSGVDTKNRSHAETVSPPTTSIPFASTSRPSRFKAWIRRTIRSRN